MQIARDRAYLPACVFSSNDYTTAHSENQVVYIIVIFEQVLHSLDDGVRYCRTGRETLTIEKKNITFTHP